MRPDFTIEKQTGDYFNLRIFKITLQLVQSLESEESYSSIVEKRAKIKKK